MRLHDAQALERRLNLKRRDDPVDSFVLLLADTRHNRRVLAEHPQLFVDLPRLPVRVLTACMAAGQHPPSCLALVPSPAHQLVGWARGSVSVNVAPPPGVSEYSIVPPCAPATDDAIDNPRPAPPRSRERPESTR